MEPKLPRRSAVAVGREPPRALVDRVYEGSRLCPRILFVFFFLFRVGLRPRVNSSDSAFLLPLDFLDLETFLRGEKREFLECSPESRRCCLLECSPEPRRDIISPRVRRWWDFLGVAGASCGTMFFMRLTVPKKSESFDCARFTPGRLRGDINVAKIPPSEDCDRETPRLRFVGDGEDSTVDLGGADVSCSFVTLLSEGLGLVSSDLDTLDRFDLLLLVLFLDLVVDDSLSPLD